MPVQQQNIQLSQVPIPVQQPVPQVSAPAPRNINWLKTHVEEFKMMNMGEKKNILGTLMFNKISGNAPESLVPKITGMLIDLEVLSIEEIIEILSDDSLLIERINEAKSIIEDDNIGN
jgi:Poly-adenylate binding protein, unique domain